MKKNMNPNSLKNLKPFVRGVSGNPSGSKKIPDELVGYLKKLGDNHIIKTKEVLTGGKDEFGQDAFILEEYDSEKTWRYAVIEKIWDKAREGHLEYMKMLAFLGCLNPTKDDEVFLKKIKKEFDQQFEPTD